MAPGPSTSTDPTTPPGWSDLEAGDRTDLHDVLGAHPIGDDDGVRFSVWAPHASQVSVVGDWNSWDEATDPMTRVDGATAWVASSPDARIGHRYKFAITDGEGRTVLHADPMAFRTEPAPETASI